MTSQPAPSVALFGSYDIRGRYPEDFSRETCRRIADAFLRVTPGAFVVARDSRRASACLERAIVGHLRERGRSVLRLGIQPTPVVGFAAGHLTARGLVFTPSHNALGYAGVKAFDPAGRSLAGEWSRIRDAFVHARHPVSARVRWAGRTTPGGRLAVTTSGVAGAYLAHVTRGLRTSQEVVVDGRGGATSRLAPRALRRAGARVTELHPRFSPTFYGLSPEPQRENIGELARRVRAQRADLGVAFDGDGDRVTFVDERGRWVEPEVIATFLHRHLSVAGQPLIASVDASQRCEAEVPTVRSRVGSRYISATMRRHGSAVGFEASSHFYLERWGPNSDGILVACVVCHWLDRVGTSLGELGRAFGPVVRDRQVLTFGTRAEAIRHYRALTTALVPKPERGIDGFVYRSSSGSVHMRLSNTQPAIRIVLEPNRGGDLDGLRRKWQRAVSPLPDRRLP